MPVDDEEEKDELDDGDTTAAQTTGDAHHFDLEGSHQEEQGAELGAKRATNCFGRLLLMYSGAWWVLVA